MNAPIRYMRGNAKCRRIHEGKECGYRLSEHSDGRCPGSMTEAEYLVRRNATARISLSMSAEEIELADEILRGIPQGKDFRVVARSSAFQKLARTVLVTAQRSKAQRAKAQKAGG